jgi:hypothetical protein
MKAIDERRAGYRQVQDVPGCVAFEPLKAIQVFHARLCHKTRSAPSVARR